MVSLMKGFDVMKSNIGDKFFVGLEMRTGSSIGEAMINMHFFLKACRIQV